MSAFQRVMVIAGACGSIAISLAHVGMIFFGATAYDFFRAGPQMVEMALRGSPLPAIVTFFIALVFAAFALLAVLRMRSPQLSWLRWTILAIGLIYLSRGAAVVLQLPGLFPESEPRDIAFSCVSLVVGLCYLIGAQNESRS